MNNFEALEVRPSRIHGSGLFAKQTIPKNTCLGNFEGPVVSEDDPHVLWVYNPDTKEETGRRCTNIFKFMNHSKRPNAAFDVETKIWKIYAIRSIRPGDEITINYNS